MSHTGNVQLGKFVLEFAIDVVDTSRVDVCYGETADMLSSMFATSQLLLDVRHQICFICLEIFHI